jgi:hypothetical protein
MLVATLYPAFNSMDFDIEVAEDAPKRLVLNWEQAVEWGMNEIHEGRPEDFNEWNYKEFRTSRHRGATWVCECNEYGSREEWILVVEDVPFYKA